MHIWWKVWDEGGYRVVEVSEMHIDLERALDGVRHMWVQILTPPLALWSNQSRTYYSFGLWKFSRIKDRPGWIKMTSGGRNILVIDSVLQCVLNKQFMGIILFQTHSYLDAMTLFLQLRRKSQRNCNDLPKVTCLESTGAGTWTQVHLLQHPLGSWKTCPTSWIQLQKREWPSDQDPC